MPLSVVVPMGPRRSCEARGATVHLACGRQGSAVPLMSPGGQEQEASMEGKMEGTWQNQPLLPSSSLGQPHQR